MEILRRLYQPVTLLVIALAVVLFINREVLFGGKSQSEEVTGLLDRVNEAVARVQADRSPGTVDEDAQDTVPATVQQPKRAANIPAGPTEVSEKEADKPQTAQQPKSSQTRAAAAVTANGTATRESGAQARAGEARQSGMTPEEVWQTWQQARYAASQQNYADAIELYRTVVAQQPYNFDAYGEMGNVMFHSGDRDAAADAYYKAAVLINKSPNRMPAWHLLNVIVWIDTEKADALYQELRSQD